PRQSAPRRAADSAGEGAWRHCTLAHDQAPTALCPTMPPMDARARKRRGRGSLLLITVLVVGGSALLGKALRTSDDVHRGTVSYFAPGQDATSDPEVVDGAVGAKTVAWDGWGFDPGHRR